MTVPVHGLPSLLREGLRVCVIPPPLKEERWHTVRSVSDAGGPDDLVALSDVSDIASAEALVGHLLLACVDDLPADYALHDVDALLGREVVDSALGARGTIEEVMTGPANDVWSLALELPDGRSLSCLVPVVDEVVEAVPAAGAIAVRIPAGTLDAADPDADAEDGRG